MVIAIVKKLEIVHATIDVSRYRAEARALGMSDDDIKRGEQLIPKLFFAQEEVFAEGEQERVAAGLIQIILGMEGKRLSEL